MEPRTHTTAVRPCAVAIVGCAGRFPGAPDVPTLWRNLCNGVESITRFGDGEIQDAFGPEVRSRPEYVKARSVLDRVDEFDAGFFGMHTREAELTDPQHRLFLECAWEALEDAGYDPSTYGGTIGIYAGCSIGSYFLRNVLAGRDGIERFTSDYQVASYPELLGSGYDFLATRVAYKLNLRGPAMTLQSACSTSLLAVTQAVSALALGQADIMLAGGVSVTFPQKRGYLYQDGGMVSREGHCRTFDHDADGTVFGDGAGVVVLKRLEDALADGDSIYAVVRGFGVNNDGSEKIGYTAPSIEGQARAVSAAYAMANVDPSTVGFVECHGTATPLGDPIEFAALERAFGASADGVKRCALGSIKTNLGHLDVASGVTGLIKAALAVRDGKIPPTLHFHAPNPGIDLDAGGFFVNTALADWPQPGEPRRAAVSSFGVGGTNVHVVLESPPAREAAQTTDPQLLVLSARTEAALSQRRTQLAEHLRKHPDLSMGDVAHTLAVGRRAFDVRCALVADRAEAAADALAGPARIPSGEAGKSAPVVAFMFPGQGAQYAGMSRQLYDKLPPFRTSIDRCADAVRSSAGFDLLDVLYRSSNADALTATQFTQPALFAVEYALAQTLCGYGIQPVAAIGHSVGELVAACISGALSLEDALALVAERGRLMQAVAPGAMLAVRASEDQLAAYLDGGLDVAAINAPDLCVLSGPDDEIARLESRLSENKTISRRLRTSHAFHSRMMDQVLEPLAARIATMQHSPPAIPWVSTVTGDWITADQAGSAEYWARHCREPVRFADALQTLVDGGVDTLVEVGPGAALSGFAMRGAARGGRALTIATLPGAERERPELEAVLEAIGRLWIRGAAIDWHTASAGDASSRISLPTYPFERTRYWMQRSPGVASASNGTAHAVPEALAPLAPSGISAAPALAPAGPVMAELCAALEELSGESLRGSDPNATFLELGFDSLALGRFVQRVQSRYGVSVTFRELLSDLPSLAALAEHIAAQLPPVPSSAQSGAPSAPDASTPGALETLMREQIAAMQRLFDEQLQTLRRIGAPSEGTLPAAPVTPRANGSSPAQTRRPNPTEGEGFRVAQPVVHTGLTAAQQQHIAELTQRVVARTPQSKRLTQRYRDVLADPRVAAGFRNEWKEMVYPITCVRAKGSRLWDADGNEYVDILNGFGQTAFGHSPDFVVDAVSEQLQRGFAIGPQTELAGEVAELFCELTGNERVTFCNTGSEAVMAALRVARTVTGRDRIVVFEGSYHGQFDEVLVKSARTSQRSVPVALGIPDQSVSNVVVLAYGTPESLEWIREHATELAAVVVESVQSRHPALRPKDFLHEVRRITQASGTAFVFDEVVTGFRMHPGGMQAVFGVRADLATYGKVVGGGLPIGILAGSARFMDALDGGTWRYGDASFPQVAPTFVAGTFVRHPLVMAAVLAVLRHVKAQGPELQEAIGQRTTRLVERLNAALEQRRIATRIESYGSLFYLNFAGHDRLAGLLYYHLRLRGVYVQEGFPCFLTTEHSDEDVATIVAAFAESLDELQSVGILCAQPRTEAHAHSQAPQACAEPVEIALTEEQAEVWLAAQSGDDASCAFNESVTLRLRGRLDEDALQGACDLVVARHDALRASFGSTGERMRIAASARLALERSDLREVPVDQREAALQALVRSDARTPFDLAAGPLVRGRLVRLGEDDHALIFCAHHIVCDGWSMNIILSELAAAYNALRDGAAPQLPEALQFSAYARRQAEREPAQVAAIENYWLAQFTEPPAPLALPTDRPRPVLKTYRGATSTAFIERDSYAQIKKAGARAGCTLFATLLGAFGLLVSRLADQPDVVAGVPAAGQGTDGCASVVGHCVDFLPVRIARAQDASLSSFLGGVRQQVLDAYEHQQYTLGTLVRKLGLRRESGRVPLAEIQFNLERLAGGVQFDALGCAVEPNPKAFVNFDLFFNVVESENGLRIDCDYNSDLFDAATIDRWLAYYRRLLDEIVRDGMQSAAGVDFRLDAERAISTMLNDTTAGYPREQTIHGLIRETIARHPQSTALRCGDASLTYAELGARINRLANHLGARGAQADDRIAICVERSIDMVVAMLATLAAGCSYVPLDPSHPPARLSRVIQDAAVAMVITDRSLERLEVSSTVVSVNVARESGAIAASPADEPAAYARATDPAYVIYTSGSTGQPKGVAIAHRSVVNLLCSMAKAPGLQAGDVLLAVTTISFDIAALELFLPLCTGATAAIASRDEIAEPSALLQRLQRVGATAMQATPALWRMLLAAGLQAQGELKMLCGGEALSRELADDLLATGGELWNMYGPTETTIWSSCVKVGPGPGITVGRPIANTQFYVLDRAGRPVPLDALGELHIAGDGVALGYVNAPDLEAQRFVPNPFGAGRIYRTGDLARVNAEGQVEILGRLDHQIKLRGFRVELGEIEAVVRKRTSLPEVVVALREDVPGERRLACYYLDPHDRGYGAARLRALAAEDLPDYMIPATWTKLERLPLTPAGKIDRAALPAPEPVTLQPHVRQPATATEQAMATIWCDVLHLDGVGLDDDFFALGGDSIQLFQITARANQSGLRLAAKELLKHPKLEDLATYLDARTPAYPASAMVNA